GLAAVRGQLGQRGGAGAAQVIGPGFGGGVGGPQLHVLNRHIEEFSQRQGGSGGGSGAAGGPDDAQNHAGKGGVPVVLMGLPILREDIDFDVAGEGLFGDKLDDGAAEIGACFAVPEAGMENAQRLAVESAEKVALEALVAPDGL